MQKRVVDLGKLSTFLIFVAALSACGATPVGDEPSDDDAGSGGAMEPGVGGGAVGPGAGGAGPEGGAGGQPDPVGSGGSGGAGGEDACPPGMVCVTSFPFVHSSTTTGAASQFDGYSCSSQDESGPEIVYRVDVPEDGFLTLRLPPEAMDPGADIDLHLLGSLDANDCVDRGHWDVGELLPAGRYYVTADTWVSASEGPLDGAYSLEIGLLTVEDLKAWGMDPGVASDALYVFDRAWTEGDVETSAYAIVDFAKHASEERMWIVDVFDATLRHLTFTTIGDMSDPNGDGWADVFSNVSGSHQSSLGLMKGAELYSGSFGNSMRLDGLEPGFNDNVRDRAIVVHPWNGSTPAYVNAYPNTGAAPTWGCLGVDPAIGDDVRQFLSYGGLILAHFPDGQWTSQSAYMP